MREPAKPTCEGDRPMLRSILVELANTPEGGPSMGVALALAQAFGARLHALSCLDERTVQCEGIRQMLEERVLGWQRAFVERCERAGVRCLTDLDVGDRRTALIRLSRKVDLLVMPGRPSPAAARAGVPSVIEFVAREAVRDVLFVRACDMTFRRIVVGFAGQENSCSALRLAAHLAEKSDNGTVHVVTSGGGVADVSSVLSSAREYLGAFDVQVECHESGDSPAEAILGTAREVRADLVAVGAYRRSRLRAVWFGETTAGVLRESPVSLLVSR